MRTIRWVAAALFGAACVGVSLSLQAQEGTTRAALERRLDQARKLGQLSQLPSADRVTVGPRTVAAGAKEPGPIVVSGGPLEIAGEVAGDAVALDGDIVVKAGGIVTGQAVSLGGKVTLDGGRVDGEIRSLTTAADIAAAAAERPKASLTRSIAIFAASVVLLLMLGIAATLMAQPALDGVATELERDFGKALLVGFLAELALVPVLALTIVGLALTIVGILVVPVAIVAYSLAAAGLLTLGVLSVARLMGTVVTGGSARRMSASGASLRGVVAGVLLLMAPWGISIAIGATMPSAEWMVRLAAAGVTWVVVTAGFGATLLSRVGARPIRASMAVKTTVDQYSWATPTPVSGVAAARRPTAGSGAR